MGLQKFPEPNKMSTNRLPTRIFLTKTQTKAITH